MKYYCLGFLFVEDYDGERETLLIKKSNFCKLEYLRGKLNGIGGSIDIYESSSEAMKREFREETGIHEDYVRWIEKGKILGEDYEVTFFEGNLTCSLYQIMNSYKFPFKSSEGEANFYNIRSIQNYEVADNLPILIPLINADNGYKFFLDYRIDVRGPGEEPLIWCEKGN